jgi:hypothetical protein
MTGEDLLFGLYLLLPVLAARSCQLFFVRLGLHRGPGMRPLRLLAGNLLVFLLVGSLLLVAGESYYRWFYDATDSFGLSKTSQRWFERHWRLNQAQVRDSLDRYEPAVPAGRRRVTFLGDSFTTGHGVADVERRFANIVRARRPGWEIHVIAWNGVQTGDELAALTGRTRFGYELDLVVLVYCLNDVLDLIPGWSERYARLSRPPQGARFLIENSYLINTLYYRLRARSDPDATSSFYVVREAYAGRLWEKQRARLRAIHDEVQRRGGQLLVVTFPFMQSLGSDYEFKEIHELLDRTWREWQVPHLDLLDVYGTRPAADLVANPYDAHPNQEAHLIAADAIVPFIERQTAPDPDGPPRAGRPFGFIRPG